MEYFLLVSFARYVGLCPPYQKTFSVIPNSFASGLIEASSSFGSNDPQFPGPKKVCQFGEG